MSITAYRHNEGASKWLITPVNIVNEDVSFTGVVNTKRRSLLKGDRDLPRWARGKSPLASRQPRKQGIG